MNKNDIIKARASGHQAKLIMKEITKDAVVQELKRQLSEKDKQIEELKEQAEMWHKLFFEKMETQIVGVTNEKLKEIRHEICEEIKNEAYFDHYTDCDGKTQIVYCIEPEKLKEIEQGGK